MIHLEATSEIKAMARKAFPSYKGRKFQLDNSGHAVDLQSAWNSGSRDYFVVLQLGTDNTKAIPQNGTMFDHVNVKATKVQPGFVIAEHTYFMGKDLGITFHVHPETAVAFLPEPVDLSRDERIVLAATSAYKASYNGHNPRISEAQYCTGISAAQFETAKLALIDSGMLNKAGAITVRGRNATGNDKLDKLGKG